MNQDEPLTANPSAVLAILADRDRLQADLSEAYRALDMASVSLDLYAGPIVRASHGPAFQKARAFVRSKAHD